MAKKPATPKIKLTQAELEDLLREQLEELEQACERFDIGRDAAAKYLALIIRVLVYDSGRSHSLLGQLGRKDQPFIDTAQPRDAMDSHGTYHGLTSMALPLPGVKLR